MPPGHDATAGEEPPRDSLVDLHRPVQAKEFQHGLGSHAGTILSAQLLYLGELQPEGGAQAHSNVADEVRILLCHVPVIGRHQEHVGAAECVLGLRLTVCAILSARYLEDEIRGEALLASPLDVIQGELTQKLRGRQFYSRAIARSPAVTKGDTRSPPKKVQDYVIKNYSL